LTAKQPSLQVHEARADQVLLMRLKKTRMAKRKEKSLRVATKMQRGNPKISAVTMMRMTTRMKMMKKW
jgi:hypothetical protein